MTNFERRQKEIQLEDYKKQAKNYQRLKNISYLDRALTTGAAVLCSVVAAINYATLPFSVATTLLVEKLILPSGLLCAIMAIGNSVRYKDSSKCLKEVNAKISKLNHELDEDAKEKDRQDIKQKTADKRISSSAVQTAQLKPTVQPESRVEKQTTSVDIDSIFDENGCLQSLDALGDIFGDDSSYSDDTPKVLRR